MIAGSISEKKKRGGCISGFALSGGLVNDRTTGGGRRRRERAGGRDGGTTNNNQPLTGGGEGVDAFDEYGDDGRTTAGRRTTSARTAERARGVVDGDEQRPTIDGSRGGRRTTVPHDDEPTTKTCGWGGVGESVDFGGGSGSSGGGF
jgi:hypothetical protein